MEKKVYIAAADNRRQQNAETPHNVYPTSTRSSHSICHHTMLSNEHTK